MPLYTYKARKLSGEELSGERDAKNKRELSRLFREEGYMLVNAAEKSGASSQSKLHTLLPSLLGHISLEERMMFARNLGVMIRAGLALTKALEVIQKQSDNKKFQKIVSDVADRVRKGDPFSASLEAHPKVFSTLFTSMVAAGEVSGKLDESLDVLSIQMRNDYDLRRKIRGALMYPAVIMVAMLIIGILMLTYVVPTLVGTFQDLEIELPASTKFIISLSGFFANNSILVVILLPVFAYLMYLGLRVPRVKFILDTILVRMPVLGKLNKEMNSARTARTMGSLIRSGVPILKSLEITEGVLQNHLFKNVLEQASSQIQKGHTIAEAFTQNAHLYPVLVGEMIAVGEETGKTAEMLERLAEFYESEVAAATKDLSSIIEPVLMVIIGTVVGFFAISMIQPLYSSIGGI